MGLGITDSGILTAANLAKIAAVAVAVTNTAAAIEMASKQEKMAKNYLKIAQEQNQYYYDVYVPCEDAELEEACSAAMYEQHQDVQVGRYKNTARQGFRGLAEKQIQCISRYCSGKRAAVIKDAAIAEAQATSAAGNLGRRFEEQFADAKDDLRWARRATALSRGRGMMADSVNFAGFAYGLFGRLGDQAAKGAAGAIGYLGYSNNRNETVYPTTTQRPQPQLLGQSFPLPAQPTLEETPMPQSMQQRKVIHRRG